MVDDTQSRRLTTIVALDVAGYSARPETDEARSTAEVAALRTVIEGIARPRGGRVFSTSGDGFMLEFGSSLAAVEAAFALAERCQPKVRVGVHLGDVVVQPNGRSPGPRRQRCGAPDGSQRSGFGVGVGRDVRRTIRGPLADRLVSRGDLQLDKMTEKIEAFALIAAGSAVVAAPSKSREPLVAILPFDDLNLSGQFKIDEKEPVMNRVSTRTLPASCGAIVIGVILLAGCKHPLSIQYTPLLNTREIQGAPQGMVAVGSDEVITIYRIDMIENNGAQPFVFDTERTFACFDDPNGYVDSGAPQDYGRLHFSKPDGSSYAPKTTITG